MAAADDIAEAFGRLHRAGWSIGSTAFATEAEGVVWVVSGVNGENAIRAEGPTEAAAWRVAVDQARSLGMCGGITPGCPGPAQMGGRGVRIRRTGTVRRTERGKGHTRLARGVTDD
jgi:hypothetical protein